jgi:hypothetical protein
MFLPNFVLIGPVFPEKIECLQTMTMDIKNEIAQWGSFTMKGLFVACI